MKSDGDVSTEDGPRTLRWAIIGSGVIATSFARELRDSGRELIGMSTRDRDRAGVLAHKLDTTVVTDFKALLRRDDVDAVYVASPQTAHLENVLTALQHGKPVLCEKPFAMTESESQIMIAQARASNLFLMEAMKIRFLPHMRFVKQALESGDIGQLSLMHLPMGFAFDRTELPRLFDPSVGGGARLDLGCYAVSLAHWLLEEPVGVTASATYGNGVDLQTAAILTSLTGALTSLELSIVSAATNTAFLGGTEGSILIESTWWSPNNVTVSTSAGEQHFRTPSLGEGLMPQVAEAERCIAESRIESDVMPLDDSRAVMRTLDRIAHSSPGSTEID